MSTAVWLGVVLLGGLGATLRFALDEVISGSFATGFPYGTLVINISGAFLLGLVSGLAFSPDTSLLLGTALIGSYTTFSTWMLETHRLREDGEFLAALANLILTVLVGFGAVWLGRTLGVQL